jgi:hypothetical protein
MHVFLGLHFPLVELPQHLLAPPPVIVKQIEVDGMKLPEVDEESSKAQAREKILEKEMQAKLIFNKGDYDVVEMDQESEDQNWDENAEERKSIPGSEDLNSSRLSIDPSNPFASIPQEDLPYIIKNLDTGEYFDIRTNKVVLMPKKEKPESPPKKGKAFKAYWFTHATNNTNRALGITFAKPMKNSGKLASEGSLRPYSSFWILQSTSIQLMSTRSMNTRLSS